MVHIANVAVNDAAQADNSMRLGFSAKPTVAHGSIQPTAGVELERIASAIRAARRDRYDLFAQRLFADPAWDILLNLTLAECRQQRVTISQLCERVDVPMTTALRWITNLTDEGMLVRREDMTDKRRKFIELSPDALSKMVRYCTLAAERRLLAA